MSSRVRGWLCLIATASVSVALSGCVDAQKAIPSASGLGEQLQTFATDFLRHLLAAGLF